MDPMDHDLDDPALTRALRRHADGLTGPIDTEAALTNVTRRARGQRRWRLTMLVGAAAATVLLIGGLVAGGGDDTDVLRAPATQPTVVTSSAPTTSPTTAPTTAPAAAPTTSSAPSVTAGVAPTTAVARPPATSPATTPRPPAATAAPAPPAVTAAPTTTSPPAPPATTERFESAGGSITLRLADGRISLVGQPTPTPGWSTRVDENGPDRVRVRFELDDERSEIRVDVEDGRLVSQITED